MKKIKPEILTIILIVLIGSFTLIVNPIIGVADNGDFYRIISQNDLYYLEDHKDSDLLGYFNKDYGILQYSNELKKELISTQSIFIKAAIAFDNVFTRDNNFDIRFLGGILLILHAVAGYLIVRFFTSYLNKEFYKYLVAIIYVIIFNDTAYIAYFNSFYGEGVIIPTFLLSIGIILCMYRYKKINFTNILLFSITSILFIGAKQQLAPIGILIAILLIRLIEINKDVLFRIISIVLAASFVAISIFLYTSIKGEFDYINRFHAMNRGVLLNEGNPEELLKWFGINSSYSLLEGEIFYDKTPSINPVDEKLMKEFYSNYSVPKILAYYVTHPKYFYKVIKMGVENAYYIRPNAMGNYEKSQKKEFGEKCYFFSMWSSFKENIFPKNILVTVVFIGVFFYYIFKKYKGNYKKNKSELLIQETYIYIFLVGFSQIIISVIGAGDADLAKHVFMFNLTFDFITLIFITNYFARKENKKLWLIKKK